MLREPPMERTLVDAKLVIIVGRWVGRQTRVDLMLINPRQGLSLLYHGRRFGTVFKNTSGTNCVVLSLSIMLGRIKVPSTALRDGAENRAERTT